MLTALELRQDAERGVALHLELRPDAPELLAHRGIVHERPPVALQAARRVHQAAVLRGIRRDARERAAAPLVSERGLGDCPALAELADLVGLLDACVRHEDLG